MEPECDLRWRFTIDPGCVPPIRNISKGLLQVNACQVHAPPGQEELFVTAYFNGLEDGKQSRSEEIAKTLKNILDGNSPHDGCDG